MSIVFRIRPTRPQDIDARAPALIEQQANALAEKIEILLTREPNGSDGKTWTILIRAYSREAVTAVMALYAGAGWQTARLGDHMMSLKRVDQA